MIREVVKIDEELCDGCGDCIPACHEGALQIIDGKAKLISDLMCDGLGACLGHCPQGAITIEKREAEPYNEINENKGSHAMHSGGCPGARTMTIERNETNSTEAGTLSVKSELSQWPVQMHLINPMAPYFHNADVIIAADCVAYALGNFHSKYLKGKSLAIACPKLDNGQEIYIDKIRSLIDDAGINTVSVMIMQVPCCGGLLQMVQAAARSAQRKVPVKYTIVGIQGNIMKEEWIDY